MPEQSDNSLARFERPTISYSLLIVGLLTTVCLGAGVAVSVRSQDWPAAGLFVFSLLTTAVLTFLYISRNRRVTAASDRKFIKWDSALPELQRQNVNLEVRELARLLGVENDSINDLLSAYIVAEDLALRQIQQEENLPLMRHVNIGGASFDGILVERDLITCIEIGRAHV